MNYLILNGAKSTELNGLLIQALPPISKPLMRTQIDEIDGRDGDIITKLGYSAYDKTVSIGLHGNYDVDAVIGYFASEGTVIFSNEPDKYYRYQIVREIDFKRLIRFKTATVTFHVQPYKYSAVDGPLTITERESKIINMGNTPAKPVFTVNGDGIIDLYINGYQVLRISLGHERYITIDTARMEAYKDGILKNRLVTGDYESVYLSAGENTISWSGSVTSINVEQYSRWI